MSSMIKLFIDFKLESYAGAAKFCARLSDALKKQDVQIVNNEDCDVVLWVIRQRTPVKAKTVLRIDGVYIEKDSKKLHRHREIKKALRKADYVIFQSQYARDITRAVLGIKPKRSRIIFNGADPSVYTPDDSLRHYKRNVIISNRYAVTKGKKHKRLGAMFNLAVEYCKTHNDVGFWFAGKVSKKLPYDGDQIKFLGNIPEEEIRKYVTTADVALHLAWYDICPNSVVEALVAGTPVICAGGSGTEEIVGDAGSILDLNAPPLEIITNSKPSAFNHKLVYDALDKWLEKRVRINKPELYIDNIARQYKEVFEEVLA